MQNVFRVRIKDYDSVVYCKKSVHIDVLAGDDEFAAAFESRVAHFELYDGVRLLLSVGDEESISEHRSNEGNLNWMRASSSSRSPRSRCTRTDSSELG